MRFIIVDDNEPFREALKEFLEIFLSHKVIGLATNGYEFLEMDNIHEADIILMDVEMPGLNGIETIKKALWQDHRLKFIAITNYTDKVYLDELIGAGFRSCVFKSDVYSKIEKVIEMVKGEKYSFPDNINIIKDSYYESNTH